MKTLLKTLLILLLVCGLVAGGVYGYSQYTLRQPVKVQPVGNWLLEYAPNQTYLGGSVTSGTSLFLYGEQDRTPLEVFVSEGQAVRVGDPLLRYDTTKDSIDLDEKLLQRQKLYDDLQALYKEYQRYAFVDWERTVPTATPTATPTPKNYQGADALSRGGLGAQRLSAPVRRELVRIDFDGDGSEQKPYRYQVYSKNGVPDPVPESLLTALQNAALRQPVHAWFETDIGCLHLVCLPPDVENPRGRMTLTAMEEERPSAGTLDANSMRRQDDRSDGSLKDPYVFAYSEGWDIPNDFFSRYCREASARGAYLYTELRGRKLTVAVDFTSMGTCILRLKKTPEPTPTPTPTPDPTGAPTPTPTPEPTATPEGWVDVPETPFVPSYGMSKAERLAYVEQLTQQLRDGELSYKQLEHDIARLSVTAKNGVVASTIDGVVAKLDPAARAGETLLEIRGGSGRSVISCMVAETDLDKYPVGRELTGFSYDVGTNVTAKVTYVSPMPATDSYSSGGNPNSSGYTMLLEVQGDVELPMYSYVEFTSFQPLSKTGAIYLYEAFVREIDGQDCIFVARDGVLRKVQVHTGRRIMEYIELVGSDLTREDYIAFPYEKGVRDGANVELTDGQW